MLNLDEIVVNMYFKSIRLLISKMVTPVIMELPVMLVFFIFIKGSLLEFFKDNDYDNAWDYLSAFGIYFIYAYFYFINYDIYLLTFAVILLVPSAIDGTTQLLELRESNNNLRLITGLLGGLGLGIIVKAIKFFIYLNL